MNIKQYLDSTYLKTAAQAGLSVDENILVTKGFIQEAIEERFKLIMIRPDMVCLAKKMITEANSTLQIGTVIDFPQGKSSLEEKLAEAIQAIQDGADDLDFVCNYEAFKNGNVDLVKEEILTCTQLGLANKKVVKWIIEIAALNDKQIIQLSSLIKNVIVSNFEQELFPKVFVKSSTGFYKTENNLTWLYNIIWRAVPPRQIIFKCRPAFKKIKSNNSILLFYLSHSLFYIYLYSSLSLFY